MEFIKNEDYKYVRALGAYYLRLTGRPVEIYQYLEPLYNDYRKVRVRLRSGAYDIVRMDEWIDELLTTDMVCDIALPHLPKRTALEASGLLAGPRRSALEDDLAELEEVHWLGLGLGLGVRPRRAGGGTLPDPNPSPNPSPNPNPNSAAGAAAPWGAQEGGAWLRSCAQRAARDRGRPPA